MPKKPQKPKSAKKKAQLASAVGKKKAKQKGVALCPKKFEAQKDKLARDYAKKVNDSRPWKWSSIKPKGGDRLTATQRDKIRAHAVAMGYVDEVKVDKNRFPKFPKKYLKADHKDLPKNLYKSTDKEQFKWLNADMKTKDPSYDPKTQTFPPSKKKYTWHHHQDTGRMQLVEFGIHNATNHDGGRTTWSTGPRK